MLDIKFICESLGMTATYSEKIAKCSNSKNYNCGTVYRLHIKTNAKIQKIHNTEHREKQWKSGQSWARRYMEDIQDLGIKKEMTCIQIDSEDHLFVTKNCIVTHNTYCTIASALQLLSDHKYSKIVYTREPEEVGKSLGYLPGELNDKFEVYMGPLKDNLEHIAQSGKVINPKDALQKIECIPLQYMRGRSFENTIIIVDEAQNLDLISLKTILTRVGNYCKIILLGSMNQIDNKHQTKENNDFKTVINKLKPLDFVGYVELVKSERSEWCSIIDELL